MADYYDLCVAAGEYVNAVGVIKKQWKKIGVEVIDAENNSYLLLDPTINLAGFTRPEGKDRVLVSRFKQNSESTQPISHDTSVSYP